MLQQFQRFFKRDQFAADAGIELLEAAPGMAVARMKIEPRHYNAVGIAHGGVVFTLADFAFAVASNAHGRVAVSINASIAYNKPTREGYLTARATEITANNKLATYEVRVTNDAGEVTALFQGTVYRKKDTIDFTAPAE